MKILPTGRRSLILLAGGVAITLLILVYTVFDPASTPWMPKCPFRLLTGLDCPGCGSQRAIHALLHGDLHAAFSANAMLVILSPVILLLAFAEFNRRRFPRLYRRLAHPATVLTLLAILLGWAVVRNIS